MSPPISLNRASRCMPHALCTALSKAWMLSGRGEHTLRTSGHFFTGVTTGTGSEKMMPRISYFMSEQGHPASSKVLTLPLILSHLQGIEIILYPKILSRHVSLASKCSSPGWSSLPESSFSRGLTPQVSPALPSKTRQEGNPKPHVRRTMLWWSFAPP